MAVRIFPPEPELHRPSPAAGKLILFLQEGRGRRARHRIRAAVRLLGCLVLFAALLVSVAGLSTLAVARAVRPITSRYARILLPKAPVLPQTTFVYDRSGSQLSSLHAQINRIPVPLSQMARIFRDAVIAAEDKNFYHESGISPSGILRAAWVDLLHHEVLQGGSTITQQYVKLMYTGSQETFSRKIREAVLAQKLDRLYTKDEILTRYLNTVYFGHGAYGVQAAAQTYFGIAARKLGPSRAALLAGLIQAPGAFDPTAHPRAAVARRNIVLDDLARRGYLSPRQAAVYKAMPLHLSMRRRRVSPSAYFADYVTRTLLARYGYQRTFAGGLRVQTTLDPRLERAAWQAVTRHLPTPGDPSAALVAIDPRTGAVRALIGGRNFARVRFDLATQARRQVGSAFKMFTLTAAMEQNISLSSIWHGPPSLTIRDRRCLTNGQPWHVANFADESAGTMTLLQGITHSVNTIFAQVVTRVGPANVADVARRMGIGSPLPPVCSITLGADPVTPLELTGAYATLAAGGIHHAPQPIQQVRSSTGQLLSVLNPMGHRAIPQNVADLVTYALRHVITEGTGVAASIGRPAAGKTGTGQSFRDAWFCGYVPQLAACVWLGYPKGEIPLLNVEGFPALFGGSIPAEIWHDFMSAALAGVPVVGFAKPIFPKNATGGPVPSLALGPPDHHKRHHHHQ